MDIVEKLKDCPKGTVLYSPLLGEVAFKCIGGEEDYPIQVESKNGYNTYEFTSEGKYFISHPDGECILFPSKDNRDWSTFKAPKKEYQFKPFDKVLVRNREDQCWKCGLFSHIEIGREDKFCCLPYYWKYCIPYEGNEYLIGTTNNPE